MLAHFIKKAHNRTMWVRPRIVIGVPSEITQVEKRAVKDSAYRAKASEVYLVEKADGRRRSAPGMPIEEASGNMVVDIGGGTTDIAVISLAGIVYSKAIRVAGNEMDEAIIQFIKKTVQPAHRRAHGRADQDGARLGVPARRAAHDGDQGPPSDRRRAEDDHHLRRGDPRGARRNGERDRGRGARGARAHAAELSADIVDRGIVLTGAARC
jgi:rod shape-determining protein MreB